MPEPTAGDPIVAEITVPVPRMKAFVAFTAQMGEWWDPLLTPDAASFTNIEVDPQGDVATVHEGRDNHVFGRMVEWSPDEAVAMDFWLGHSPEHPSRLTVTFDEVDGTSTRVRLEHGGWDERTADVRDRFTHWDDLLARYAAHVAAH